MPTSRHALDVTIQAQILDLLGLLQERHDTAILLISHDLALVSNVATASRDVRRRDRRVGAGARAVRAADHPYTLGCSSRPRR